MTVVATSRSISPALKSGHHLLLVDRFHASVNQAHRECRQGFPELDRTSLGGLGLEDVGFVDQWTDPVGLATRGQRIFQSLDHLVATLLAGSHRGHRFATGGNSSITDTSRPA